MTLARKYVSAYSQYHIPPVVTMFQGLGRAVVENEEGVHGMIGRSEWRRKENGGELGLTYECICNVNKRKR